VIIIAASADEPIERGDHPRAEGDDRREPHQAPVSLDLVIER
jgi:hypothetical protein